MPVAGVPQGNLNYFSAPWMRPQKKPNAVEDQYKLYGGAVKQQAGDYDSIMGRFKNLYGSVNSQGAGAGDFQWKPYQAEQSRYAQSGDTTQALARLRDLAETGGYSAADQQNIRARGVSPIRAVYANAQRNMDRQRALQGGYSPNYNAATSKMTRELSDTVSEANMKVNADLAQAIQQGKLAAAPAYASASERESENAQRAQEENTNRRNDAQRFNLSGMLDTYRTNRDASRQRSGDLQSILSGMTNLYGTTPALSNLYGSQAQDSRNFQANQNQNRRQAGLGVLSSFLRH